MEYKNLDDLPLVLTVELVGKVLGINKNSAYQLARSESFPATRINKRIVVYRPALAAWLQEPKVVNF